MFFKNKKPSIFILIVFLLMVYNHCGKKSNLKFKVNQKTSSTVSNGGSGGTGGNGSITYNFDSPESLTAFQNSVYQLTRNYCINCHRPNGSILQISPYHAHDSAQEAHDSIINLAKVDFTNPANSRLAKKLVDQSHNCWSDCTANSIEMAEAIETWANAIAVASGGNGNENQGSNLEGIITAESLPLSQELENGMGGMNGQLNFLGDAATLAMPMVLNNGNDPSYVWVPEGDGNSFDQNVNINTGFAYWNYNLAQADNYYVWGLVNAPSNSSNSFFVRFNFSGAFTEWHITPTNGFEWRILTSGAGQNDYTAFLPAGNNQTLELRHREDGTQLSMLVVTDDVNFDGSGINNSSIGTLSYDLSGLLGGVSAQLLIDFQDFDMNSYRFFNPRIVSNSVIQVKNIKPYINGVFNPLHNEYTLVDTVVNPGNPNVSNVSMIAVKDQGFEIDQVAWSFEILQVIP